MAVTLFRYDRHCLITPFAAAVGAQIVSSYFDDLLSTIKAPGIGEGGQNLGSDIGTETWNGQEILILWKLHAELVHALLNLCDLYPDLFDFLKERDVLKLFNNSEVIWVRFLIQIDERLNYLHFYR